MCRTFYLRHIGSTHVNSYFSTPLKVTRHNRYIFYFAVLFLKISLPALPSVLFDPLIIHQRECYIPNNVLYSCCLLSYWLFYTLWPLLDKMEEELVVGCENAAAIAGGRCRHFLWPLFPGELQHAHQHHLSRCRVHWEFSAGGNITTFIQDCFL